MDYIIQFFLNITGDEETGRWVVIGVIALAVFALVIAVTFLIFGIYNPIWKRLHIVTDTEKKGASGFRSSAETLGNYFVIRDRPGEELSYTRQRLLYAGLHTKNSLAHYYGIRIILILFFLVSVLVIV